MNNQPSVGAYWLEYRVAAQYSKSWDDVEELLGCATDMPGSVDVRQDPHTGVWYQVSKTTIGSASFWMQQVDPPAWFKRDELGIGTGINVYHTAANLERDNKRRDDAYHDMLARLEKARESLMTEDQKQRKAAAIAKRARIAANMRRKDRPRDWVPMDPNYLGRWCTVQLEKMLARQAKKQAA